MNKIVIIYSYFETPISIYNLKYFVKAEISLKDNIDYVIVINGDKCSVALPEIKNLKVIKRVNHRYDFSAYSDALKNISREYDYYFFLNSSVIGPIIPHYFKNQHWTRIFTDKINDTVKLVGTTVVCLPDDDLGGYGPKVEGFFFCTDKLGLKLLEEEKTIFCIHNDKVSAIVNGEYGISNCILKHGYSIDCMLHRYQNIDWKNKKNWNLNNNIHPSRKNSFYGMSINPYEVIFHKWFWVALGKKELSINIPIVSYEDITKYISDIEFLESYLKV
jgi:hypothetical protein